VVPLAIFSKNARILTVIFIGHRQLDNTFFFLFTHYCMHRYTFCLHNNYLIFFILLKKKKKTDRYYVLKEILYEILLLEASIQGEIIANRSEVERSRDFEKNCC
jgi:hypothetical protein